MRQNTTSTTSLRDLAAEAIGAIGPRVAPTTSLVTLPAQADLDSPATPEAKAAMAAAVVATRFRVNTDLRTLISTEQARAIARTAVSAYVQQFRRVSEGGAQ